jgi:hypothetical protein
VIYAMLRSGLSYGELPDGPAKTGPAPEAEPTLAA